MPPKPPGPVRGSVCRAAVLAVATLAAAATVGLAAAPAGASTGSPADAIRQSEWFLAALHAPQAWHTAQGSGVTVALLADGVNTKQADIAGSVIQGPNFVRSVLPGPHASGKPPRGRSARKAAAGTVGTGLASLIAGHGHGHGRASGVTGIAPAVRVLSITVTFGPGDSRWSKTKLTARLPAAIAAGIRYAVQHGASVIALPADPGLPGRSGTGNSPAASGGSAAERAAVDYALSKGVVLVAPAGDNAKAGGQPAYPAGYPGVIAVGAAGKTDVALPTSSRMSYVALAAPGLDIAAAGPSGYQTMSGTWPASALVAGIAALVRSQFPNLTASQVRTALVEGAASASHSSRIADALGALNAASTMSPPHAQPAMLGARVRTRPVSPLLPTSGSLIARDLVRDGVMSAALLGVLLVLILGYSESARRREHRAALVAEREKWSQQAEESAIDPLLEFFRPQHARPPIERPRPQITPRYSMAPIAAARPPRSISGQIVPVSAFATGIADPPVLPAPDVDLSSAFTPSGRSVFGAPPDRPGSPLDPGSIVSHRPVTGAPPWEPAPRPTSDLPWSIGPTTNTQPVQGESVVSDLQPLAAPAPPGPPQWLWEETVRAATGPPVGPGSAREPKSGDSSGRPIYVWNPPTESSGSHSPPWPDQPAPWDNEP